MHGDLPLLSVLECDLICDLDQESISEIRSDNYRRSACVLYQMKRKEIKQGWYRARRCKTRDIAHKFKIMYVRDRPIPVASHASFQTPRKMRKEKMDRVHQREYPRVTPTSQPVCIHSQADEPAHPPSVQLRKKRGNGLYHMQKGDADTASN